MNIDRHMNEKMIIMHHWRMSLGKIKILCIFLQTLKLVYSNFDMLDFHKYLKNVPKNKQQFEKKLDTAIK